MGNFITLLTTCLDIILTNFILKNIKVNGRQQTRYYRFVLLSIYLSRLSFWLCDSEEEVKPLVVESSYRGDFYICFLCLVQWLCGYGSQIKSSSFIIQVFSTSYMYRVFYIWDHYYFLVDVIELQGMNKNLFYFKSQINFSNV